MKRSMMVLVSVVAALGFVTAASAADSATVKETATAHTHALMAQGADTVKMAHAHLHHVVNCLVGVGGKGYDANAANPCKGLGTGALPDSKGDASAHAKIEAALADAQSGLQSNDLDSVHMSAGKAASALQATPTGKPY